MAFSIKTRKAGRSNPFCKRRIAEGLSIEVVVPAHFRCPISLEMMRDPVTASTGITYDRQSIETWLDTGNSTCPVTNQNLADGELIPNHSIRRLIQDWCVANRSYGVERIPTPRIPVTLTQASEILSEIAFASHRGDRELLRNLCAKVRALAKESDRNRRCIVSAGAGRVLAASFGKVSAGSIDVLDEILSTLVGFFPLDEDALSHIGSAESLNSISRILISKRGDVSGLINSVSVLKELLAYKKESASAVAETEGLIEALVELVKEPTSPQATKASLVAIYYLVSSGETVASKLADMGLIPLLLGILVDSEKSSSEKALATLEKLFDHGEGRERGYRNALTVPLLVKKMFRVSDMGTELAVSALWKLCKRELGEGENGCLAEALQVGAFQKLLLLLQVGCSGATKEKTTDLLKLFNGFKGSNLECIDTLDFKGLKRSN